MRWCSARWCATTLTSTIRWGSCRAGVRVDFQIGANAYLYGTRFFTYLAYVYSPEKVIAWLKRDEGSERYYADQFQRCSAFRSNKAGRSGSHSSTNSRKATSPRCASIRSRRTATLAASAVGSISRMYYDEASGMHLRGIPLSGLRRARRRAEHARRNHPATRRHQARDALPRRFLRLRPGDRHRLLHERQPGASRSHGGGRARPASHGCCWRMRASARSSSTRSTAR